MNKNQGIFFCFLLMFFTVKIKAQTPVKLVKQAGELALEGNFYAAKLKYLEAYKLDSNNFQVNEELGLLLVEYLDDMDLGFRHLQKAISSGKKSDKSAELQITYARCLQYKGNYNEAIDAYTKSLAFADKTPEGQLLRSDLQKHIENCKYSLQNPRVKNLARYKVKNLGPEINTAESEYAPVLVKDESVLLFTSRRKTNVGGKIDSRDNKYFEDMFISYKRLGKFTAANSFSSADSYIAAVENTDDHDAVVSVSPDGNILYLFKLNGLYQSVLGAEGWSVPARLPEAINEPNTYEAHACINENGKVLYFSSNRAGGYGGLDIYRSVKGEDGSWGAPENLGPAVNTAEDEDSPFISKDGKTLYFSSKGLVGYGGYDIFKCTLNDGKAGSVENIGTPFNSNADDIYFSINSDETIGFLASSRNGGYGDMDLYEILYFDRMNENACMPLTNQIPNEDFYIDFKSRDSVFVNDSIVFDASLSKLKNAFIVRHFWKMNDSLINTDSIRVKYKFPKEGVYTISLQAAVFADTAYDRQDYCITKTVSVFNPKAVDDFYEPLLKKDEEKITITGTADVLKIAIDSTKKDVLKIKLDPIFFDSDKFNIRKDAAKTLDANIAKMKVDKNIIIKVTAHTDSRASREYNLKLSQKRANSVIAYLNKKGVKKDRILAVVAMGEDDLINDCGDDKKCNEELNQRNRRAEFKIIGSGAVVAKPAAKKASAKTAAKAKSGPKKK